MAYDEQLAERIRRAFTRLDIEWSERKMFGGIAFMLHGNMCIGVSGEELMVRVGVEQQSAALRSRYARPMDFTGRPMKGYVFVANEGLRTAAHLRGWVVRAITFAETLPPK